MSRCDDLVNRHAAVHININININIKICSIELKWDDEKLKYDMITRWEEYE